MLTPCTAFEDLKVEEFTICSCVPEGCCDCGPDPDKDPSFPFDPAKEILDSFSLEMTTGCCPSLSDPEETCNVADAAYHLLRAIETAMGLRSGSLA